MRLTRPNIALARLAMVGSRDSWGRLVGIAAGIAVGVTLFLLLFGAYNGLNARQERSAWLQVAGGERGSATDTGTGISDDEVLVALATDFHAGASITRLDVAATEQSRVQIPGLEQAPAVGDFYASPALIERIGSVPAKELGDRYGTLAGTIPDSVLSSPDSLVAITGETVEAISNTSAGMKVSEFTGYAYGGNQSYLIVTIIGGIAVLLPVLILVGIVTKLGAAERRERFATLRLIGATPRTVTLLAAWETAAPSLAGAVLGAILALVLRPVAALVPIDDGTFFVSDLAISPVIMALVMAGTVTVATLVAARSIQTADIGPLGRTRQQQEKRPRAVRLIPLALGLCVMILTNVGAQTAVLPVGVGELLIGGFALTSLGLIVAGPYLTWLASTLISTHASSAAGVVAVNRIRRAPAATFRSASGLVIAVFMVSVFAAAATTATEETAVGEASGLLPLTSLIAWVNPAQLPDQAQLSAVMRNVKQVDGVRQVAIAYSPVTDDVVDFGQFVIASDQASGLGFENIPDGDYLAFDANLFTAASGDPAILSPVAIDSLAGFTPSSLYVETDGTQPAIERARTALENSGIPLHGAAPSTRVEAADSRLNTMENSYATLAYLGIGVATLISGISLTVATAATMLDRKRVLGLLRLMGMPVSTLRRIISYEAAAPLLAIVALSIVLGFFTAYLILSGLTNGRRTVGLPDPRYLIALASSVLLALIAVVSTFGSIRRNTAISSTRFE